MGYKTLSAVAFAGFVVSVVLHILACLGVEVPNGSWVFFLSVGIFPLWFLLIMAGNRTRPSAGRGNMKHLTAEVPKWIRTGFSLVGVYAIFNFFYFLHLASKYPKHAVPFSLELRGISGYWMLFYGMSAMGLFGLHRFMLKQKNQTN